MLAALGVLTLSRAAILAALKRVITRQPVWCWFRQDSVQGLFDKARQSGAEEGTAADLRPQVSSFTRS